MLQCQCTCWPAPRRSGPRRRRRRRRLLDGTTTTVVWWTRTDSSPTGRRYVSGRAHNVTLRRSTLHLYSKLNRHNSAKRPAFVFYDRRGVTDLFTFRNVFFLFLRHRYRSTRKNHVNSVTASETGQPVSSKSVRCTWKAVGPCIKRESAVPSVTIAVSVKNRDLFLLSPTDTVLPWYFILVRLLFVDRNLSSCCRRLRDRKVHDDDTANQRRTSVCDHFGAVRLSGQRRSVLGRRVHRDELGQALRTLLLYERWHRVRRPGLRRTVERKRLHPGGTARRSMLSYFVSMRYVRRRKTTITINTVITIFIIVN